MIQKMKQSISAGLSGLALTFMMATNDVQALDVGYSGTYLDVFERLRVEDGQIPIIWGWAVNVDGDPKPRKVFLTTDGNASGVHILVGSSELDRQGEPKRLKVYGQITPVYFPLAGRGNLPRRVLFPESMTDSASDLCLDITAEMESRFPDYLCDSFNELVSHYVEDRNAEVLVQGRAIFQNVDIAPSPREDHVTIVGVFTENNQKTQNGEPSYAILISSSGTTGLGWEGVRLEMTSAGWTPAGRFVKGAWRYQIDRARQSQQKRSP